MVFHFVNLNLINPIRFFKPRTEVNRLTTKPSLIAIWNDASRLINFVFALKLIEFVHVWFRQSQGAAFLCCLTATCRPINIYWNFRGRFKEKQPPEITTPKQLSSSITETSFPYSKSSSPQSISRDQKQTNFSLRKHTNRESKMAATTGGENINAKKTRAQKKAAKKLSQDARVDIQTPINKKDPGESFPDAASPTVAPEKKQDVLNSPVPPKQEPPRKAPPVLRKQPSLNPYGADLHGESVVLKNYPAPALPRHLGLHPFPPPRSSHNKHRIDVSQVQPHAENTRLHTPSPQTPYLTSVARAFEEIPSKEGNTTSGRKKKLQKKKYKRPRSSEAPIPSSFPAAIEQNTALESASKPVFTVSDIDLATSPTIDSPQNSPTVRFPVPAFHSPPKRLQEARPRATSGLRTPVLSIADLVEFGVRKKQEAAVNHLLPVANVEEEFSECKSFILICLFSGGD